MEPRIQCHTQICNAHQLDNATTTRQGTLLQLLQKVGSLFLGNLQVVVGVLQLEQLRLAVLPIKILQAKHKWVWEFRGFGVAGFRTRFVELLFSG